MERSFRKDVAKLRLGAGEEFSGEGVLAVAKALLQSGVSYVGGYQGSPVSHLLDVLVDSAGLLDELGVHLETPTSEAAAAAMLGASINYPMRGAVTWKSTVGTNVASDALSNLASAGVRGGALIVLGEDYGEGASIIQERSQAFAIKSSICLLDPRPTLPAIVRAVENGFALSEASSMPVMLELRIRACHVHGRFVCKDNLRPAVSRRDALAAPDFDYGRICLPPATYAQEKHKVEHRIPAAARFIRERRINETIPGEREDIGIVVQGGLTNTVLRALADLDLADAFGASRIPLYVVNAAWPIIDDEIAAFCAGKERVLTVEEGHPDYLEQAVNVALRRADLQTRVQGKDVLPMAGEYTAKTVLRGVAAFVGGPGARRRSAALDSIGERATEALGAPTPARPPSFCTGCPERPVFSAMKIVEKETGPTHVAADIGCHTFSTLPPFDIGNTVLGYGLGLASAAGVSPNFARRTVSVMGDGGFWHNGLASGVASGAFNRGDGVLVIFKNGYTSATGWQYLPSSRTDRSGAPSGMTIEGALRGLGVRWVRTVRSYDVARMVKTLREALTTRRPGAEGYRRRWRVPAGAATPRAPRAEQASRRRPPHAANPLWHRRRGVHRRSLVHPPVGLSVADRGGEPRPAAARPGGAVNDDCVGCGLCGSLAHAATLCPSFYRLDAVHNPTRWERLLHRARSAAIRAMGGGG